VIETKRGEFHWEIIDLALSEAREHGQTLAIRLMPYTDKHALPDWYRNSGARRANIPSDKDGSIWHLTGYDSLALTFHPLPDKRQAFEIVRKFSKGPQRGNLHAHY
jgi:hypothetical protein